MKRISVIACIGVCLLPIISSCKKDIDTPSSNTKTTQELLLGEWIINHEAMDNNDNSVRDESEIDIRNDDLHWVFETNGHALRIFDAQTNNPTSSPYDYTLDGDVITLSDGQKLYIELISENELRTRTTTTPSNRLFWQMYDRK